MSATVTERTIRTVQLDLPRKLSFLMEMHPYKVAFGGRNSLKSWSFARALLTLGIAQDLRVLCCREVQKTLADSVHQLLRDQIAALNYDHLYDITDNAIRGARRDTLFRFTGLSDQTADSIKSYEGFDVAWVEEAQSVTRRSWQILLPTIFRVKNSEVWVSFNPGMEDDETWQRFVVNPPPGAVVVSMNWRDAVACDWWNDEQEALRQYDLKHSPDDYDNIWEGRPRSVVEGAIYTREISDMIMEQRYRPTPYDPRFPVHRIWDLGWRDLMVVIMVQKPTPSSLTVVNYLEEKFATYAMMIQALDGFRYRWGDDWLPHDSQNHNPISGTNAFSTINGLTGRTPRLIPKSADEPRIRAARMMFPRVLMDNNRRDAPPDRPDRQIGAFHLMERLRRLRRVITKSTGAEGAVLEDINIHAGDAWGSLAEIVDQIRNAADVPRLNVGGFVQPVKGMGVLG